MLKLCNTGLCNFLSLRWKRKNRKKGGGRGGNLWENNCGTENSDTRIFKKFLGWVPKGEKLAS
jgi:hypothetical protein